VLAAFLIMWAVTGYSGPCTHPAIEKRSDGGWYCTECGQRRS
jgi:hypothetical protein